MNRLNLEFSLSEVLWSAAGVAFVGVVADDALIALATLILLLGLKLVSTGDRLFVMPAAFAFHWSQTTLGLLYFDVMGREVPAISTSDYRPMVLIGLGCVLAIAVGVRLGLSLVKRPIDDDRPQFAFSLGLLATIYISTVGSQGILATLALENPSIRQILVSIDTARLGLLFLILRRLLHPVPRWGWVSAVVLGEVVLGITGFFAGFREPIVLAAIATLEIFDRRNVRHWIVLTVSGVAVVALGMLWMAIRGEYRREFIDVDKFQESRSARVDRVSSLGAEWLNGKSETMWETADKLVDRMWTVYYPALALARVPSHVPHSDGEILKAALIHIVTPRIFFPGKPNLQSDSEKVRKYSGVMVAGAEQNTSIAFGYAAESYVDFGLPWMFLPVVVFGVAIGWVYALFRKLLWHHELFISFATVTIWLALYLFERSWATMLGVTTGLIVYLGVPVLLLDRLLLVKFFTQKETEDGTFQQLQHPSQIR